MTAVQAFKKYLWIFIKYFSVIFFSFVALLPIVSCVITALKTKIGRASCRERVFRAV